MPTFIVNGNASRQDQVNECVNLVARVLLRQRHLNKVLRLPRRESNAYQEEKESNYS